MVDDAPATAFAFTSRRHSHFAKAAGVRYDITDVRLQKQNCLERGQIVFRKELRDAGLKGRSFNKHHRSQATSLTYQHKRISSSPRHARGRHRIRARLGRPAKRRLTTITRFRYA